MLDLSEDQIIQNWSQKYDNAPIVSICCITYNQVQFIQNCLDGFLMQKTNFPFEIIIHDDCSTDGTIEILKKYVDKYPRIINCIFEKENQYSKGNKGIFTEFVFPKVRGKYIAMCEGDDYWIDENKIQRQVDYICSDDSISLVAENTKVINSIKDTEYLFSPTYKTSFTMSELIERRKFATSSVLFKTEAILNYLSKLSTSCDTIIWVCCAAVGRIEYLPFVSSVYRRGMQGITENSEKFKWALINEEWMNQIEKLFSPPLSKRRIKYNIFKSFLIAFYNKNSRRSNFINILKKLKHYYQLGFLYRVVTKW